MIKILIITSGLTAGGVDTLILNTLSEMNQEEFHVDLLVSDDSKTDWEDKFKEYGCNIFKVPRARSQGLLKAIHMYKKIIKDGNYDLVHSHIGFGSVLPVIAVSFVDDCKVIAHAHYDNFQVSYLTKIVGHMIFSLFPCEKLACSYGAGQALFGKRSKFVFMKNGIDSEKFSYNERLRYEVRKELFIEESCFVVGTVGRMQYQKNHEFLIKIFDEIKKKNSNSKLLLVGEGELKDNIKKQVKSLGLQEHVLFLGIRKDVYRILQALDVFIMPTRYEGLSLALLEVECSGLPCLTSDVVPNEAKVTENFHFISLSDSAEKWADIALSYKDKKRISGLNMIKNAGFDKKQAAAAWFNIYRKIANEKNK